MIRPAFLSPSARSQALLLCLLALFVLVGSGPTRAARTGPGLGNLRYRKREVNRPIFLFNAASGAPRAHGTVAMHQGYLVVPFSVDGPSDGGFAFYDVSNPRRPRLVARREDAETREIREPHGYGFTRGGGEYVVLQAARGLQFWDWTDVSRPRRLSYLELPGIEDTAYGPAAYWAFWQAPYVYVGCGSQGVYIVDAADPAHPSLVQRLPTSQTGGFQVGAVYAVGNLLVVTAMNGAGYATLDISDPERPFLIAAEAATLPEVYSATFNGGLLLGAGEDNRLYVHDATDPTRFTLLDSVDMGFAGRGGYATFQDGFAHVGASTNFVKADLRKPAQLRIAGRASSELPERDEDFATVLGNLVFIGNDHGQGSALVPHQARPDRTPPAVNLVMPRRGAAGQPLTTRIGLTFTDQIDFRSVDARTVVVRPLGGRPLAGRFSYQSNILNWHPAAPLEPETDYEIVLAARGVRDLAGNSLRRRFVSRFSTGPSRRGSLSCDVVPNPPVPVDTPLSFQATASGRGPLEFSWSFGDGTPPTPFSAAAAASHVYERAGHYAVRVTVRNREEARSATYIQTVYAPPTPIRPAAAGTLALDGRDRLWCVNPDADTVTAIDTRTLAKLLEAPVGRNPRTLALAPDGTVWVANQGDGTISVLDGETGATVGLIALPYASQPYGVAFSPDGSAAYVTLQARGQLARLDPTQRAVTALLEVGPSPRGIAISADGERILVTRFISAPDRGEIVEVSGAGFQVARRFPLEPDPGPDSESSGRGVPNYLSSVTISPDGKRAWYPAKKDNTARGLARDGRPLTFETTVRTIVGRLDLVQNRERLFQRKDLNDRDMAAAVAPSPLGDYLFVASQGSNTVDVLDAYTNALVTSIEPVGLAPQGLVLSPDGTRLYVQSFMSRSVSVWDTSGIAASTHTAAERLAEIATVAAEPLPPDVLLGKQIFYNARDPRMSRDGYLSCASCHLDGGSDGRTWDFTDRGEGLRQTISLLGRRGMGQGRVHWTANFDEIQDFEHDIRGAFGGSGFLADALFHSGTRGDPLGAPKAGLSPELDALAAYVASLTRVNPSPFRNPDGSMTADALAGRGLFRRLDCGSCHTGPDLTDSATGALHDVGTLRPASGKRSGQPLAGLDTPTLKGIWETAPYLHDGSAATLLDALTTANPEGRHGAVGLLSGAEQAQLVRYLLELDDTPAVPESALRRRLRQQRFRLR